MTALRLTASQNCENPAYALCLRRRWLGRNPLKIYMILYVVPLGQFPQGKVGVIAEPRVALNIEILDYVLIATFCVRLPLQVMLSLMGCSLREFHRRLGPATTRHYKTANLPDTGKCLPGKRPERSCGSPLYRAGKS
jgi:hypothetical protein